MLQILFIILKILGILLLVVLGVLLAVLLLVLFVPLRYQGEISFDAKTQGQILVSWLLHFFTARVSYDGSVKVLVKVLWFRLFNKTVWPEEESQISDESDEIEEISIPVERAENVRETKRENKTQASKDQVSKIEKYEKTERSKINIKTEKQPITGFPKFLIL